ncbi:MAG: radical SAM protein, partial [Candidatus Bathyarchaeota archaeon]|nr:radical SAM protein [Candidatus Bathyarchaeota archaeon]
MGRASREFQVFVKPIGPLCNLDCSYCYYLDKEALYPKGAKFQMPYEVLEKYIKQHIEASPGPVIRFSWHGGEPTLLGLDYFRKVVALQHKYQPSNKSVFNGIQTNGTLLDDEWCRFFAGEGFGVGLSMDGPQEIHDRYRVTKDQKPTHEQVMRGYRLLQKHLVNTEILCVVNAYNVQLPLQVYRFFKQINARYITFLPLVEKMSDTENG